MKFKSPAFLSAPVNLVASALNTRSPREKLMILAFGGIFILLMDVVFLIKPVVIHLTKAIPEIGTAQTELSGLLDDKKNKEFIHQKWEKTTQKLKEKENGFKGTNQLPELLEILSKIANDSKLKITSLNPAGAPVPTGSKIYYSVPIDLSAEASTHELGSFLSRIETGDAFFKISNLVISPLPANPRKQKIDMKIEAYQKK